tara:strand:+ start:13790 stop:14014 length:225 start_codon:yes stop_codon:yes gene_type:complete
MFSKEHVEKIQRAAGVGNNLDLFAEVELMPKVTWIVTQQVYDMLRDTGSIIDDGIDQRLVYNSMLIKLEILKEE